MRTLAVLSRKGGTGKTTISVGLALAAARRGYRVLLADLDPQVSASHAALIRAHPGLGVIETTGGKLPQLQLTSAREGVDLMLIDTPGAADGNVLQAIRVADLCLIVTRPNGLDLRAVLTTIGSVTQLGKPGLMVLNQAPSPRLGNEHPMVRSARETLSLVPVAVTRTSLRARSVFQAALAAGRGVEDHEPGGPAAAELAGLWTEVAAALGLQPPREAPPPGRP